MMNKLQKLGLIALSMVATVPLVAAATPSVNVEREKEADQFNDLLTTMVNHCRVAYAYYRAPETQEDPLAGLNMVIKQYPDELKPLVVGVCRGYGDGYEDAERGRV